jgi:hypothetical protein
MTVVKMRYRSESKWKMILSLDPILSGCLGIRSLRQIRFGKLETGALGWPDHLGSTTFPVLLKGSSITIKAL